MRGWPAAAFGGPRPLRRRDCATFAVEPRGLARPASCAERPDVSGATGRGRAAQIFFPEWHRPLRLAAVPASADAAGATACDPAGARVSAGASSQMISASAVPGSIVADLERSSPGIGQLDRALVHPPRCPAHVRRRRPSEPERPARATGSAARRRRLPRTPDIAAPGSLRSVRPEPGDPMRTSR